MCWGHHSQAILVRKTRRRRNHVLGASFAGNLGPSLSPVESSVHVCLFLSRRNVDPGFRFENPGWWGSILRIRARRATRSFGWPTRGANWCIADWLATQNCTMRLRYRRAKVWEVSLQKTSSRHGTGSHTPRGELSPNPPVDGVLASVRWLPEGRGEARRPSGPAGDCSGRSDW